MDLPKIKKRISNFILKEEGRISKQSLISMGAFLGGAVIGVINSGKDVYGGIGDGIDGGDNIGDGTDDSSDPEPSGPPNNDRDDNAHSSGPAPPPPHSSCPDLDWDKGCPGREPGNCGAVSQTAAEGQNAYNDDGSVKYVGDGYCVDDEPFHFNGIDFSYAGKTLTAKHHHHGSHNSY